MKPFILSVDELEKMKAALESDIIYQKKQIEKKEASGTVNVDFVNWLIGTEALLRKVNLHIIDLKANEQSGEELAQLFYERDTDALRIAKCGSVEGNGVLFEVTDYNDMESDAFINKKQVLELHTWLTQLILSGWLK